MVTARCVVSSLSTTHRPRHGSLHPLRPSPSPCPHPVPYSSRNERRKTVDFDGKVAWEAYLVQFGMLADAQDWDEAERALQLVSCLHGTAVEMMGHLTLTQYAVLRLLLECDEGVSKKV